MTNPEALFRISSRKSGGDQPLGAVRGFPLLDLVRWAATPAGKEAGEYGKFGLPPVQRGSVWKPKQIVDLWDSVFRGLPIGSFYLVQRDEDKLGRELSAGARVVDMGPGWSLLDGQQRLHALIRGWQGPLKPVEGADTNAKREATFGAMRCLWVDLAASVDGVPRLHITSNSQPFGYDPATGEKLRSDQLRNAREKAGYTRDESCRRIWDHELFAGLLSGRIPGDGKRWPPKPILAEHEACVFPLHELLDAWLKPGERMCRKQSVEKFVGNTVANQCLRAIEALDQAFQAFHGAEVALIRVSLPSNTVGKGQSKAEQMLRLFDRIGSGGTILSQEERLYSVYKSYQPHVHDAVEAIYEDCGAVLSPVKICGVVIRIAYARINERPEDGNNSIDVAALIRHLSGNLTEWDKKRLCHGQTLEKSLNSLIPDSCNPPVAHPVSAAFKNLYTKLALRQETAGESNPTGLPDVMLASLPANCVEVLVMAELTYPPDRQYSSFWQDAIAFVLIWQLLVTEPNGAAAVCFERMRTDVWSTEKFPFRSLYAGLVSEKRKPVCLKVVAPDDMKTILQVGTDHRFATWKERFSPRDASNTNKPSDAVFTENNVAVAERWWGREGALLLRWWQRGYLTELYGGFRPAFGSDEDTPYDIDHLIPRKDWGQHWASAYNYFDKTDTGQDPSNYRWTRGELGESIGNKWLLDRSVNRKAGDSSLANKLDLIETSDDRMKAAIGQIGKSMDGAGRKSHGDRWSKQTLSRFQTEIQTRAAELYKEFYETLKLGDWRSDVLNGQA